MLFTGLRTLSRSFRCRFGSKLFAVTQPRSRTYHARIGDYGYKYQSARTAAPVSGDNRVCRRDHFGPRQLTSVAVFSSIERIERVYPGSPRFLDHASTLPHMVTVRVSVRVKIRIRFRVSASI